MKKKGDIKIDSQSVLQNKIENMLITTSWVDKVKALIGLKAVSPVWGDKPGWYFWISKTSCAYYFELRETLDDVWDTDHLASGLFMVKCYPYANTQAFHHFSFEEQAFVQSELFDHTHTPRFEQREIIPDSLFNVAAIELTIDSTENLALFSLEALDSIQVHHSRKYFQSYPEIKKEKRYNAGEKASDIPGYDLSYPFFSSLLSLYSFYSKKTPARIMLTRSPGFKYVCSSPQKKECVDTDDTHIYSLNVLFSGRTDKNASDASNLIDQRFKASPNDVMFDQKFTSAHLPKNHISPFINTPLDEKWWSLATADYTSDMESICGCDTCHH